MPIQGTFNAPISTLSLRDGRQVTLGLLTLEGMSRLEAWCRREIMARAKEMAAAVPEDGRASILQEGTRHALKCSLGSETCQSLLQSPAGMVQMLELVQNPPGQATADEMAKTLNFSDAAKAMQEVMVASMGDPQTRAK